MLSNQLYIADSRYPFNLKCIPDPPEILYYKGSINSKSFNNCLAIVGSRVATSYGIQVLKHLFKNLSRNITIVSGFMTGIDYWAHRLALENGMQTVAVMPCGIDEVYPVKNTLLHKKVLSTNNLILSEYPGDQKPFKWSYVKRNRIIAGLSKATLVVEANISSGSLITASYCNKYKRPVLAIPGNIFSEKSKGCNQLLNTYGIAVSSSEDIHEILLEKGLYI